MAAGCRTYGRPGNGASFKTGSRADGYCAARSILCEFVDRNADSIIDLESKGATATQPGTLGWRDSAHIYLRPEPLRDQIADLLDALEPHTLKPGGEAGLLQYKMPATKVSDRPRVYRFDVQMLEDGLCPRF